MSGKAQIDGLHRDARAKVDLDVSDLRVGRKPYGKLRLVGDFDGHEARADVRVDQGTSYAEAKADTSLSWRASLAPLLEPSGATHASFVAKKFQIGFVAPFVQSAADTLDGVVDADARVNLNPGRKPEMSGAIVLADGILGLAAIGQELHAVKARVTFSPDGIVRLEDASAAGTTGKVTAVGVARLDGTALVGAEVDVDIPKRDALPVDVEGTDLGSVYGKLAVKMNASADRSLTTNRCGRSLASRSLAGRLDAFGAGARRPARTRLCRDVRRAGSFRALAPRRPFDRAGRERRRRGARREGPPRHRGDRARHGHPRGADRGPRGEGRRKDDCHGADPHRRRQARRAGKELRGRVRDGHVHVGIPSNPGIKVTAGWTADDGTRVFADYVGPLKTGKVTLRSEPARPVNEIVALIAFGSADGSEATPYAPAPQDTATQAGTTVGGLAATGLNQGLDKLTGLDITAKVDTSQANPRPEVEVQIARNLSLELSVVLGTPPPGTRPGHDLRDRRLAIPPELVAGDDLREPGKLHRRRGLAPQVLNDRARSSIAPGPFNITLRRALPSAPPGKAGLGPHHPLLGTLPKSSNGSRTLVLGARALLD